MKKYFPVIAFMVVVLIGAFLRLYRIGDYMAFLGDEGRDALVVKRMIVDGDLTLLGPITSVGLMHLGPIYYYFMAPFLWLSRLNPVGPAIMVALFSLGTIWLIYITGRDFFNFKTGFIAALLFSLSPFVIFYSHSSWNPNILPFWGLLLFYGLLKAIIDKKYLWLIVAGLAFGVAIQLHYTALAYLPIICIIGLIYGRHIPGKFWGYGFLAAVIAYAPYIIFELRHQFINTQTVLKFIARTGGARTFGFVNPVFKFWDLAVRSFWRLVVIGNELYSKVLMLAVIITSFWELRKSEESKSNTALKILLIWFLTGIGSLAFYTGNNYDYYLLFILPVPILLIGNFFSQFSAKLFGKIAVFTLLMIGVVWQVQQSPISKEPNRLAFQTEEIADFILARTGGHPYNFALIAAGNSDHAYRYFLEINGKRPVVIESPDVDPDRQSVAGQLFVVCEEKVCEPLGHSLWEIAGFGRAEIAGQWQVGLFKVYKLIHYVGQE